MQQVTGITLRAADDYAGFSRLLLRNPGLSVFACDGETRIGCILAGQDGRRGYLYHLAVLKGYRRQGVGHLLVKHCIREFQQQGIDKVHVDVRVDNPEGAAFWEHVGGILRVDLLRYSLPISENANA